MNNEVLKAMKTRRSIRANTNRSRSQTSSWMRSWKPEHMRLLEWENSLR